MEYAKFTYNNIKSENYGAFIMRDGSMKFFSTPSFSNDIVSPKYSDRNILLGTEKESRTIDLRIILLERTLQEYEEFLKWINFDGRPKRLSFDYSKDWYYNVVPSAVGEAEYDFIKCVNGEDVFNIEIDISFDTVGDWAAQREFDLISGGDQGFWRYENTNTQSTIRIENIFSLPIYFKVDIYSEEWFGSYHIEGKEPDDFRIESGKKYNSFLGTVMTSDGFAKIEDSEKLPGSILIQPGETLYLNFEEGDFAFSLSARSYHGLEKIDSKGIYNITSFMTIDGDTGEVFLSDSFVEEHKGKYLAFMNKVRKRGRGKDAVRKYTAAVEQEFPFLKDYVISNFEDKTNSLILISKRNITTEFYNIVKKFFNRAERRTQVSTFVEKVVKENGLYFHLAFAAFEKKSGGINIEKRKSPLELVTVYLIKEGDVPNSNGFSKNLSFTYEKNSLKFFDEA